MKLVLFIFTVFLMSSAIASENSVSTARINFDLENLLAENRGMFLITENYGEIPLHNVQFDEDGYFTEYQFTFCCERCSKYYKTHPESCVECGYEKINLVLLDVEEESSYYMIQALLHSLSEYFSTLYQETILCGVFEGQGSLDNKGKKSASVSVKDSINNGKGSYKVTGEINKDPDGKINAKLEGKIKYNFRE